MSSYRNPLSAGTIKQKQAYLTLTTKGTSKKVWDSLLLCLANWFTYCVTAINIVYFQIYVPSICPKTT